MSLLTKFLKLILPSGTDYYNIDDFNKNFTALDEFAELTKQSISDLDVADIKQSIMAGEDGKPVSLEYLLRSQNEKVIVSPTEPINQPIGGIWFDTSGSTPSYEGNTVVVANAHIGSEPPQNTSEIWFDTNN